MQLASYEPPYVPGIEVLRNRSQQNISATNISGIDGDAVNAEFRTSNRTEAKNLDLNFRDTFFLMWREDEQ